MVAGAPSLAYYRSMQGRWRGTVSFEITDGAAFRRAPLGWVDRLWFHFSVLGPKLLGAPLLETSVDITDSDKGLVLHTTRALRWGLPLFSSVEVIALHENGRNATMKGNIQLFPLPWPTRDYGEGQVVVNETSTGAVYHFDWFGVRMEQRTLVVPDGLQLVQETAWARGEVLLRRLP